MLTFTITHTAKAGPGERALEELLGLDSKAVLAGLFDPEQATKGAAHEFASDPERRRPWASLAADSGARKLASSAESELGAVADGRGTGTSALDALGAVEAEQLRAVITGGKVGGPALKPATVARKGHSVKLLDTGDMLVAITHKLDDGSVDVDG